MEIYGKITTEVEARKCIKAAVISAAIVCTITLTAVLGGMLKPDALIDAVIFGIMAWQISKGSRAWAVSALVLFVLEKIIQIVGGKTTAPMVTVAIAIVLGFVEGIRGTYALHRILQTQPALPPVQSTPQPPIPSNATAETGLVKFHYVAK